MLATNEVIYREVLSNVGANHKPTLYAIAADRIAASPMSAAFVKGHSLPSASAVQSALRILVKTGLVVRTDEGYSVSDPLLRIFINGLYSTAEI